MREALSSSASLHRGFLSVRFTSSSQPRRTLRQGVRSPGPVELLFVGRFVQSKGILDLVEAAAGLHRAGIPFKLRLAGNQAFSDAAYVKAIVEAVAASDMEDEVVFVGQVSEAELQNLYAAADIFAMPSYHEGFACRSSKPCLPVACR